MERKSMTALVSAFSRAYHRQNNIVKIFDDSLAEKLLLEDEYEQISQSMAAGIGFFNPAFEGTAQQALRWVVDNQLSPLPLGRAAFAEKTLERAVQIGARQYLILGAGYDTFAYRQPDWAKRLEIFEIDLQAMGQDKRERLNKCNIAIPENVSFIEADFTKADWQTALISHSKFSRNKISCCTMLGLVIYLSAQAFENLISVLSRILPKGSSIIFDYPDENSFTPLAGERAKKQAMLAGGANEKMIKGYSYNNIEQLLSAHGFLIYEHLTAQQITQQYFSTYNSANKSHTITGFDNAAYCLAVLQ